MSRNAAALQPLIPAKIDELATRCRAAALAKVDEFAGALALAEGVNEMRQAIQPLIPKLRALAGSPLGFRTDKQYPDEVLTEAVIEAMVRGVRPIGNEFNVIGGRCYITKEGYTRLVREVADLTDLVLSPGVPRLSAGGAVVPYKASWRLAGRPMVLDREIPVRLNAGMGVDAAIGKATRKMLAAIHGTVTGSVQSIAETDAEDLEVAPPKTEQLADRLAATRNVAAATPEVAAEDGADVPDNGHLFGVDQQPDLGPLKR